MIVILSLLFLFTLILLLLSLFIPKITLFFFKEKQCRTRICALCLYSGIAFLCLAALVFLDNHDIQSNLIFVALGLLFVFFSYRNYKSNVTKSSAHFDNNSETTNFLNKSKFVNKNDKVNAKTHTVMSLYNLSLDIKPTPKKPFLQLTSIFYKKLEDSETDNFYHERAEDTFKKLISLEHVNDNVKNLKKILNRNIEHLLYKALEDNYISEQEETHIREFSHIARFDLTDINNSASYLFNQAIVVRNLLERKVAPFFNEAPVLLSKNEIVIWYENNCDIMMPKTVREYHAGSRGVSIKLAKGLYYHMGRTKGHSESKEILEDKGKGYFVVTNKNVFVGAIHKKIPLGKIISLEENSQGLIIWAENNRGKPIYVDCSNQAFYINAINNAQNWA